MGNIIDEFIELFTIILTFNYIRYEILNLKILCCLINNNKLF